VHRLTVPIQPSGQAIGQHDRQSAMGALGCPIVDVIICKKAARMLVSEPPGMLPHHGASGDVPPTVDLT